MDLPLLSKDDISVDETRKQKKRKRQKREASLLQDVIARATFGEEIDLSRKSESTERNTVSVLSADNVAAREESSDGAQLDSRVPLRLYIGNLSTRVRKCHVEAWCLGEQNEFDMVSDHNTMNSHNNPDGSSSPSLRASDLVEVRLVPEDRANPGGAHKGFGFVELANHEASARVLALDGSDLMGQAVAVRPARGKHNGKGEGKGGGRRFGSLDYTALAEGVERKHKQLVAAQVKRNEEARAVYLVERAKKAEAEREFVVQGGVLPGGLGHGYDRGTGLAKLHSGYRDFDE